MPFLEKYLPVCLFWVTCSFAFMPIEPYGVNSACMITWAALVLLSVFVFRRERMYLLRRDRGWLFLLFSGTYFFLMAGMLRTVNAEHGWRLVTTSLPMILFPFGFLLGAVPAEQSRRLLRYSLTIYHTATFLLTIWIFLWYWRGGLFSEFARASRLNLILRHAATAASDRDSDYLSFYLAFAIYIAGDRMMAAGKWPVRVAYGLTILPMGLLLLMLASRSPILGFVAGSFVICFLRLKPGITRWVVSLSLVAGLALIVRFTPAIYSRFQEVADTPLKAPVGKAFNSTNLRVGIFKCTWQLISEHPVWGIGTGSDRTMLPQCYQQFPAPEYQRIWYNTHNQYLDFWLSNGIFDMLVFVGLICYSLLVSYKRKDHVQLFFTILMSICFLSEDILTRQAGNVFFYFFLSLMEFSYRAKLELNTGIAARNVSANGLYTKLE